MLKLLIGTIIVGTALPGASASYATPNSPCAVSCGNVLDATSQDEISCTDSGFGSGDAQLFQGCVKCEMTSRYTNRNTSDVHATLYNLRYTLSSCLWGVPGKLHTLSNSPCLTSKACGVFEEAITFKNASRNGGYDYCDKWPVDDGPDIAGCRDCLHVDHNYLANFFMMLQAGCQQKPPLGTLLGIEGNIFSSDQVTQTTAVPLPTVNPEWFDQGPLTIGSIVGISFGGLAVVLAIAGFFVVCLGKRRRKAYLRTLHEKYQQDNWPSPQGQGDTFDTPISQRPLNGGWQDSPMSETADRPFPRYVSPYSSQFNSPVSAQDMISMPWPETALPKNHNIGVSEVTSPTWEMRQDGKGKAVTESYEMHDVENSETSSSKMKQHETPVIAHPGYGRNSDSSERSIHGLPNSDGHGSHHT